MINTETHPLTWCAAVANELSPLFYGRNRWQESRNSAFGKLPVIFSAQRIYRPWKENSVNVSMLKPHYTVYKYFSFNSQLPRCKYSHIYVLYYRFRCLMINLHHCFLCLFLHVWSCPTCGQEVDWTGYLNRFSQDLLHVTWPSLSLHYIFWNKEPVQLHGTVQCICWSDSFSGWKLLLQYEDKVNSHSHTDSFNSMSMIQFFI